LLFVYACLLSEIIVTAILLLILSAALIVRGSDMHPWAVVVVVALIALCAGALRHYVRKLQQLWSQ
jgi:glycerol uptake facilitator-like aquaporin